MSLSLSRRVLGAVAAAAPVVALPAGTAAAASPTTRASLILDDAHVLDDGQVSGSAGRARELVVDRPSLFVLHDVALALPLPVGVVTDPR